MSKSWRTNRRKGYLRSYGKHAFCMYEMFGIVCACGKKPKEEKVKSKVNRSRE